MFKKIITSILWTLLLLLFAGYFVFAEILTDKVEKETRCHQIEVTILDSAINRFVSRQEVLTMISKSGIDPMEKLRSEIDIDMLEQHLTGRSAIKHCNISLDREGYMRVEVSQRRPLIRLETANGGFYIDEQMYILPLVESFSSYVPIISGEIPLNIERNYRGFYHGENRQWLEMLMEMILYINRHPLWSAQIQQIEVERNLDLNLYNRVGDQKVIFGQMNRYEYKLAKLEAYYRNIVPVHGWEKYSEVNLKYSDQIVCTKRSRQNKK
ncbi:MAG: hypothetical protein IKC17_00840 [Bacteroidales bacterium]|nr:hypothetical protein [Bacteroidales bacterium]